MAFQPSYSSSLLLAVFLALACFFVMGSFGQEQSSKLYIVHMGEKHHQLDADLVTASHHDVLTSVIGSKKDALSSLVYSYRHGFSGFAANLTDSQAKKIAELSSVASVKPSRRYHLHTTRSWDFLGVINSAPTSTGSLLEKANHGEDVIIGIIDTGIWPESQSFNDTGYSPIPSRWKGICQSGQAFGPGNCNRKIVGARWYNKGADAAAKGQQLVGEYLSPRDSNGHGTHTASTAAGSLVRNVSYHGLGAGMARGGAPRARLAVYKVCWGESGCSEVDVLKAMEDVVQDGVDVMSLSIGGDGYAPASLHAITKGIPVVFSAGNDGPAPQTVENEIPWALSVAASTIDRSFPTVVTLGNKQKFLGQSIFYELNKIKNNFTEIVDGASCDADTLNATDVRGKIVLCYSATSYETVPRADLPTALSNVLVAGGRGLIFMQTTTVNILENLEQCRGIPCVLVDMEIALKLLKYMNSASIPMVKVTQTVNVVGSQVLAPEVAAFSSRGPSSLFPAILKPDITAPGVSVLAATGNGYGFMSGTSMSCPHVSGVVALLKSLHPDWSPAAIKSALVTTASAVDGYGQPIEAESTPRKLADPFDFGGGHINPNSASDPGLVYDIGAEDYLKFFECSFGPSGNCNESADPLYHLNLPSIVIPDLKNTTIRSVWRTVTNVGSAANVTYKLTVESPPGVSVVVKPRILRFSDTRKVHKFKVSFTSARRVQGVHTFGSITWSDGNTHSVRIPIAVRVVIWDSYADTA